jgi:DNA ligase-1
MKAFTDLYLQIDSTTKTNEKVEALVRYFETASAEDAAWAVYFLIGRKLKRVVDAPRLRAWAATEAGVPDWLFAECYDAVGDVAETIALLLADSSLDRSQTRSLTDWIEHTLIPLREADESNRRAMLIKAWNELDRSQRFVWNKLITGGFRVGVSQRLVERALARASGIEEATIAHRLMGDWNPTPEFYRSLIARDERDADVGRPYPFCLAYPVEGSPEELGSIAEWRAEWKWDGIRAQVIKRSGRSFIWTRGEELVDERYPELAEVVAALPNGTVIDGEILAWRDDRPLGFDFLQKRIGRLKPGKKLLAEIPVILIAYDMLEFNGIDIRDRAFESRRDLLNETRSNLPWLQRDRIIISEIIEADSWKALADERDRARSIGAEGLMLKRSGSPYRVGRKRGDWWKWKVDPLVVDAVLIAARRGHGKRAGLYTDYTFGVWKDDSLVPIAQAYSGLTDDEIQLIDKFVHNNMIEKFGPVRTIKPELVFELAFEGIRRSPRHKSGIAVRFPRIVRIRTDKVAADADRLETLSRMIPRADDSNASD